MMILMEMDTRCLKSSSKLSYSLEIEDRFVEGGTNRRPTMEKTCPILNVQAVQGGMAVSITAILLLPELNCLSAVAQRGSCPEPSILVVCLEERRAKVELKKTAETLQ